MLQMGDTVGPRYTTPKISAISYLFKNFFFVNNGRHRTTALNRFPRSIGPRYNGAAVYIYILTVYAAQGGHMYQNLKDIQLG